MKTWRFSPLVFFLLVASFVIFGLTTTGRLWAAPLSDIEAAGLSVQPANQTVTIGDTFTVTVAIAGVDEAAAGFQFDLAYNPALISFDKAAPGVWLHGSGRFLACPEPTLPTAGTLRFACASAGDAAGTTGDGVLVDFNFTAIGPGISPLNLSAVQLADDSVPPLALTAGSQNGQVTIGSPTAISLRAVAARAPQPLTGLVLLVVALALITLAAGLIYRRRGTHALLSFLVLLALLAGNLPLRPAQAASAGGGETDLRAAPGHAPCYDTNLDCDTDVDENDLNTMAGYWDCASGDACYSLAYDLDGNGVIDALDMAWVGNDYDIAPPQITFTGATLSTGATTLVEGVVTDDHPLTELTLNGTAVSLSGNNFSASVALPNGNQVVNAIANNTLDQAGFASQVMLVDNEGPMVAITTPADRQSVYSYFPEAEVQYTDFYTTVNPATFSALLTDQDGVATDVTANFSVYEDGAYGSLGGPLTEDSVYTLTISVADSYGHSGSDSATFYVPAGLYEFDPPYAFGEIAWASGVVYDSSSCSEFLTDCQGMAGVRISAATIDPESRQTNELYGEIVTGPDGFFAYPYYDTDFLTLRFAKPGYTYSQREIAVVSGRSTAVNAVYLTPYDTAVTACDSSGCSHTSADGLMELDIPAGAIPPGATVNVVATSFDKVQFLPGGELPPGTAETYAFNLSGASDIQFTQPITVSMQNYRNFAPGTIIPLGYWNPETLQWEHAGTGQVDPTGQWVVVHVNHFSNYDINAPVRLPGIGGGGSNKTKPDDCPAGGPGCFINYKSGQMSEVINDLPATNVLGDWVAPAFSYSTERANAGAVIDVQIDLNYNPFFVHVSDFIQFEVYIEGEKTDQFTFEKPETGGAGEVGRYRYLWDGRNALDEPLPPGIYEFALRTTITYTAEYCIVDRNRFGSPCRRGIGLTTNGVFDQWTRGSIELNAQPDSPYGEGWLIEGQQRLYEDEAGRVLVADSSGVTEYYFDLNDQLGGYGQYFTERPPVIGPAAAVELPPVPTGGTFVAGTLTADTTWTLAGSPYNVVTDNVIVPDGVTLTIEPGVEVLFGQYRQLFVEGTLDAVGTPSQPITFSIYATGEVDTWGVYTITNSIEAEQVSSVTTVEVDDAGQVYLAGRAGFSGDTLDRMAADGLSIESVAYPPELDNFGSVTDMARDGDGRVWFATDFRGAAVLEADGSTWTVYNQDNSPILYNGVNDIAIDNSGDVWLATDYAGVVRFTPTTSTWVTYTVADGLVSDVVLSVAVEDDGDAWFGTDNGLSQRTAAGVWTTYDYNNSPILGDRVLDIALDAAGNGWLVIQFQGVSVLSPGGDWTNYTPDNSGLVSEGITSVLVDGLGRKWFGHEQDGVSLLLADNVTWFNESRPRLASDMVSDIALAPNGDVWLANGEEDCGGGGDTGTNGAIEGGCGGGFLEAADGEGGATRVRRMPLLGATINPGFWGALQIGGGADLNDSNGSQLSYVNLVGGGFGVPGNLYLYHSTPAALDHLTIEGSGGDGLYAFNSSGLVLDTAEIKGNEGDGVRLEGSFGGHSISNLTAVGNSGDGLEIGHAGSLNVVNSTFEDNRQYGLYTSVTTASLSLNNSQIENNRVAGRLPADSSLTGNSWTGNRRNEIEWMGGVVNQDVTWGQLPGGIGTYRIIGGIVVTDGVTLTVEPGVDVLFDDDSPLEVRGALNAVGTEDAIIYFGPGNDDFDKLVLGGGNVATDSDGSQLGYAFLDSGNLRLEQVTPAPLDHLTVLNAYYGLEVISSTGVIVANSNFINTYGGGVYNQTPADVVTATMNFWGAPNGPYHPDLNPAGQGVQVSDGVVFDPWSGPIRMDKFQPVLVARTPTDFSQLIYDEQTNLYVRVYPDGREVHFDYYGRHESTLWPDGRQEFFYYNYDNSVYSWGMAPAGQDYPLWNWYFNYDYNGKLTTLIDPAGRVVTFTVDSNGDLAQVDYPDGSNHRFYYDSRGLMTQQQNRSGGVSTYTYSEDGRLVSHTEPLRSVYDPETGLVEIVQVEEELTPSDTAYPLINESPVGSPADPAPAVITSPQLVDRIDYGRGSRSGHTNRWGAWLDETDGEGRTTEYEYSEANLLTRATYPDGDCTLYSYDGEGNRLAETTLPAGQCGGGLSSLEATESVTQTWQYSYEARFNQVKSATDPLGRTTTYVYDYEEGVGEAGKLIRIIFPPVANEFGLIVTPTMAYSYNLWGQLETETDARGSVTRYVYSQGTADEADGGSTPLFLPGVTPVPGLLTRIIRDEGGLELTTTFDQFDGAGNPYRMIGPDGHGTMVYSYDSFNRVASSTDAAGIVTTYEYDARGNLIEQVEDYTADGVTGRNIVTTFSYDPVDRLLNERTAADGLVWQMSYGYDINGEVGLEEDGRGNQKRYYYDLADQLVAVVDSANYTTTLAYHDDGRLSTMTDPDGFVTRYLYDGNGRLSGQVVDEDGLNLTTSYSYDLNNNRVSTTDPAGMTTCWQYDSHNRPAATIYDCGGLELAVNNRYDLNGNLARMSSWRGLTLAYQYDALNRLTLQRLDEGGLNLDEQMVYDPAGNLSLAIDERGVVRSMTYDLLNRLVANCQDNLGLNLCDSYSYDRLNNQVTATDGNGVTTRTEYNAFHRPVAVIGDEGERNATSTTGYDNALNRISLVDANGNETGYSFTARNEIAAELYADGTTVQFVYDGRGNTLLRTNQDGSTISYSYDGASRVISDTFSTGGGQNFAYDGAGRLLSASQSLDGHETVTTNSYDVFGSPISLTQTVDGKSWVVGFGYDYTAPVYTTTYPSGVEVTHALDILGRLDTVSQDGAQFADYSYDDLGSFWTLDYDNGVVNRTDYDALRRTTRVSSAVADYRYGYDGAGNRSYMQRYHLPGQPADVYLYDGLNQLTRAWYKANATSSGAITSYDLFQAFGLDDQGNRLAVGNNGVVQSYSPHNSSQSTNVMNRYEQVGSAVFSYDLRGNLLSDSVRSYSYDILNRQDGLTAAGVTADYVYNALGQRVAKVVNGVTTYAIYNADYEIIEERAGDDSLLARYTYGGNVDEPLTMERGGNRYYYHRDALGSVSEVTDDSGAIVERYEYDVYGRPSFFNGSGTQLAASAVGNPHLFTGRFYDPESGNYDYRARTYSPATGRFLQLDPLGYIDGLNLYAYTQNNPVLATDPGGTKKTEGRWSDGPGLADIDIDVNEFRPNYVEADKGFVWLDIEGIVRTRVYGTLECKTFCPNGQVKRIWSFAASFRIQTPYFISIRIFNAMSPVHAFPGFKLKLIVRAIIGGLKLSHFVADNSELIQKAIDAFEPALATARQSAQLICEGIFDPRQLLKDVLKIWDGYIPPEFQA